MAKVSDLKQAFLMLRSDRVDLMMVSVHGLNHVLSQFHESKQKYQVVWQVNKIGNYFAFHRNTPDTLIMAFQQAFDQVSKERQLIKKKYQLPEMEY